MLVLCSAQLNSENPRCLSHFLWRIKQHSFFWSTGRALAAGLSSATGATPSQCPEPWPCPCYRPQAAVDKEDEAQDDDEADEHTDFSDDCLWVLGGV